MIKAIIFDFDGTILDTETHELSLIRSIYEEYNEEFTLELWKKTVGANADIFCPYKHLESITAKKIDHNYLKQKKQKKLHRIMQQEKPLPGVISYLEEAKRLNLKIGLASSSEKEWVINHLQRVDLLSYFECICTSDDVQQAKPDPSLYLKAMNLLNVNPEHSLAIEDSPNGTLAAKRAGMWCMTVPNKATKELEFGKLDINLASLQDLKLIEVLEYVQRNQMVLL
ncbi:HAD family hydrolase [Bacillus cereus]|uniref:HAD family hydrolase n=1 Tax=Bacillus cereus TaxID=1396 RepID=UPI00397FDDB8